MLRRSVLCLAGLCAALSLVNPAAAAGASRDEAKAQVYAAVAHVKKVGAEQAARDFNTGAEWKVKGMNVNFVDMKGVVLASSLNERLVGKSTYEMKDPAGKAFVKDFVATAQKGEGWIDYQFINPESKQLEERSMFVHKAPGVEAFVGVAITK